MRKIVVMLCLSLFFLPNCYAANKTKEYKLKNGLKLIVREDHRAPVVVSQICYKVGSAYEPGGLTGVSHVLEHMMFKGTRDYNPGEFSKIIASNGGQENAYTSRDYTCYFQKLSASKLPLAFTMEADRMYNLSLADQEFKKEIQVVKEERRMRTEDNPKALTYERFHATAHIATPYRHPIVGWMNDLDNMKIKDVRYWYHSFYAPNNAILIVVGDVKPKKVLALAKKHFGTLPKAFVPISKPQKEVKNLGKRHLLVKAPAKLPWLIMGYNTPSVGVKNSPKWQPYALEVLAGILDGGDSARLPRILVRKKEVASSVGVSYDLFSKYAGLFVITATPASGHDVEQVKQAIKQELHMLQQKQVTAVELKRVKTQVIAETTYMQDSQFYQAMLLGRLQSADIHWSTLDKFSKNIQAVTAQQVQRVARKFLRDDGLTVAQLVPLPLKTGQSRPNTAGGHHHVR